MYRDRIVLYQQIEEIRGSKILVYVTGDRPGMETQIHPEVLDYFVDHLDSIKKTKTITLYLYTRGGNTLAAWSIVNFICQYCDDLEVIVPSKAHSAGTLICLGANRIIMTRQATLGPIDPSINTPLNPPIPGAPSEARFPVSVEAINGFIELAKSTGINESHDLTSILNILSTHVHPLVLGQVYRTRTQIRMLGGRLLSRHMSDKDKIEKILSFLCSESGSHDYMIYRQEAQNGLGLNIEYPSDDLYNMIKNIYDDIANELELTKPYNPLLMIGRNQQIEYKSTRGLIESVTGGSHKFVSKGILIKRRINDTEGEIVDSREWEGWEHERI